MELPVVFFAGLDGALRDGARTLLSGRVAVRFFADGDDLKGRLEERQPDIVVVGASLPGVDPLEFCRALKNDWTDIRVCLTLGAADVGRLEVAPEIADELWGHPVTADELVRRVLAALRQCATDRELKTQLRGSQQVAMTAMSSMGELGVVLRFLSDCFAKDNYENVAEGLLSALDQYGYAGACQIHGSGFRITRVSGSDDAGASEDAMTKLSTVGRIFEFKSRMVVNYPNVTLMVLNLGQDAEVRGRARDNLAMLAEGAQARVISLMLEHDNRRKRDGIGYALTEIRDMALSLEDTQRAAFDQGSQSLNEAIMEFYHSFVGMGLSESQESRILDRLDILRDHVRALASAGSDAARKLQAVSRSLQELVDAGESASTA